jgi:hypothetical protein
MSCGTQAIVTRSRDENQKPAGQEDRGRVPRHRVQVLQPLARPRRLNHERAEKKNGPADDPDPRWFGQCRGESDVGLENRRPGKRWQKQCRENQRRPLPDNDRDEESRAK